MGDDDSSKKKHSIEAELGNLKVKVQGDDGEWVQDTFEDVWDDRLDEAEQMGRAIRTSDKAHQ